MAGSFAQCAAVGDVNKMALSKADAAPVQVDLGSSSEVARKQLRASSVLAG